MKRSIQRQLLFWLLLPLSVLSLVSSAVTLYMADALATDIYDDELLNSADSVAARIQSSHGRLSVDMPASVLSVLRHDDRDLFYYEFSLNGKRLDGNCDLPAPSFTVTKEPQYETVVIDGRQVRLVSMLVANPEPGGSPICLSAAETGNTRVWLVEKIHVAVMMPLFLLIVCSIAAVWIGVRKGLAQLAAVQKAVSARSPGDLRSLEIEGPAEIQPMVVALNNLLGQLREDIERQSRFTSNAAHQLRTPLAGLATYCGLALKLVQDSKTLEVLKQMQIGITRMTGLVNQLLSLARCEPTATISRNYTVTDLNALASDATAELVPASIEKMLEIEFEASDQPARVFGDSSNLHELAKNLIENAVMYTQPGGKIVVGVFVETGKVTLYVDDDGPGIPSGERERVFERFYRMPGTEPAGTGLGLAIVGDIAKAHRARVLIETGNSGTGTLITVCFPECYDLAPAAVETVRSQKQ